MRPIEGRDTKAPELLARALRSLSVRDARAKADSFGHAFDDISRAIENMTHYAWLTREQRARELVATLKAFMLGEGTFSDRGEAIDESNRELLENTVRELHDLVMATNE